MTNTSRSQPLMTITDLWARRVVSQGTLIFGNPTARKLAA